VIFAFPQNVTDVAAAALNKAGAGYPNLFRDVFKYLSNITSEASKRSGLEPFARPGVIPTIQAAPVAAQKHRRCTPTQEAPPAADGAAIRELSGLAADAPARRLRLRARPDGRSGRGGISCSGADGGSTERVKS